MYLLIIAFYLSLLGIIAMLLFKRHEVTSGKPSMVSELGRSSDQVFHTVFGAIKRGYAVLNRRTFISITQWVAYHILLRTRKVYVDIKDRALSNPHSKKVIDAVRGRGEVTPQSASFYLRRISDK